VTFAGVCAFATLAVDWGRVQLVKTELRSAADAAARHAVAGLSTSVGTANARAVAAAGENKADGGPVVLVTAQDVEFGTWDPATRAFEVLTGSAQSSATAVRVTARRTSARGTAIPTLFGALLGRRTVDVTAVSIASRGFIVTPVVRADACPWLAGMPGGSTVAPTGGNTQAARAPANSPLQISNLPLVAGGTLYFRQTTGQTSYEDAGNYGPDGNTGWIVRQAAANGINATRAPLNCLVGIFLDNRVPSTYAMAAEPDFTTEASRDFTTLSPQLKQVFFIGDGLNSHGDLQKFTVPNAATRLFVGLMDEKGWWWDNTGQITTTTMDSQVRLVK